MTQSTTMTILVAHGSRDPQWAHTFVDMTLAARQDNPNTALAFMELNKPSIEDVVQSSIDGGFRHFIILPLFLARGKHLKRDIPEILRQLEQELPITTELLAPIGEHPEVATAIANILTKVSHSNNG